MFSAEIFDEFFFLIKKFFFLIFVYFFFIFFNFFLFFLVFFLIFILFFNSTGIINIQSNIYTELIYRVNFLIFFLK